MRVLTAMKVASQSDPSSPLPTATSSIVLGAPEAKCIVLCMSITADPYSEKLLLALFKYQSIYVLRVRPPAPGIDAVESNTGHQPVPQRTLLIL